MFTRNRVEITGNIAKQPEIRSVGETTVTSARLLHNETIPRAEREPIERVIAIDLEIWGKRGESFAELATTKNPIHVEGRLQMDQWEQNGQPRSKLLLRVDEWQFLLPKAIAGNAADRHEDPAPKSHPPARRPPYNRGGTK